MKNETLIFYDCETTGLNVEKDLIIELAACRADSEETFSSFIFINEPIPQEASQIHGITNEEIKDAPIFSEVFLQFKEFCGNNVLVAHNNNSFDYPILKNECLRHNLEFPQWTFLDSLKWAKKYCPHLPRHSLQYLRQAFNLPKNQAHRALDDVITLKKIFSLLVNDLTPTDIVNLLNAETVPLTGGNFIMPFGKYQGRQLQTVPPSYIKWLKEQGALDKTENQLLLQAVNVLLKT